VSHDHAHVITAPEKLQKWKNLVMLTDFRTFMKYQHNLVCAFVVSMQLFEASSFEKRNGLFLGLLAYWPSIPLLLHSYRSTVGDAHSHMITCT
jgi:hypothetical protein